MTDDEGNEIKLSNVPYIDVYSGWVLKINGNEIKATR